MGDTPLMISFGPIVDRMFIVALSLIIFVYGTTAVMWVYNEIEKLLNRFWKIEPEETKEVESEFVSAPPVLYQVMWSEEIEYGYLSTVRIRIVADPMEGAYDLIKENGAGYIRYRVWISDPEPWGLAKWYGDLDYRLELPKFPEDYDLSTFSSTEGATFTRTEKKAEDDVSN